MKVGDNLYVLYLIICSLTLNAFIELRHSTYFISFSEKAVIAMSKRKS